MSVLRWLFNRPRTLRWFYTGKYIGSPQAAPQLENRLKARWMWNAITRFVVASVAAIILGWATAADGIPSGTPVFRQWLFPLVIFLSCFTFLLYMKASISFSTYKVPNGRLTIRDWVLQHPRRTYSLEFSDLALNFVFLFGLVSHTGGITSMFLPLYVIGLLLSDISLETDARRNVMMLLSFTSLVMAALVPHIEGWRQAVLGTTQPILWQIGTTPQFDWLIGVLITATFFGSVVLRGHFTNGLMTTINGDKAQPPRV